MGPHHRGEPATRGGGAKQQCQPCAHTTHHDKVFETAPLKGADDAKGEDKGKDANATCAHHDKELKVAALTVTSMATAMMTKITTTAATQQSIGTLKRRRDGDGDEDGDRMRM